MEIINLKKHILDNIRDYPEQWGWEDWRPSGEWDNGENSKIFNHVIGVVIYSVCLGNIPFGFGCNAVNFNIFEKIWIYKQVKNIKKCIADKYIENERFKLKSSLQIGKKYEQIYTRIKKIEDNLKDMKKNL